MGIVILFTWRVLFGSKDWLVTFIKRVSNVNRLITTTTTSATTTTKNNQSNSSNKATEWYLWTVGVPASWWEGGGSYGD